MPTQPAQTTQPRTVLVIGATGQVGRVVVAEALERGDAVRAVTRNAARARLALLDGAQVVQADPASPEALAQVVAGVGTVVLAHGTDSDGRGGQTFYDVVVALLDALRAAGGTGVHVSLMTTMNASHSAGLGRGGAYGFIEWKRRAERVLRVSGQPYTIMRPGWFDYQAPSERRIDLRQGDLTTGQVGVDRRHVAQALLDGATVPDGNRRTVEVFSVAGAPVADLEEAFAATRADADGALDGVLDAHNVPLTEEPARVQEDVARLCS